MLKRSRDCEDNETCGECVLDLKRQKKPERKQRYYFETRDRAPMCITRLLRTVVGPYNENVLQFGRLFQDGSFVLALNGEITIWWIDPLQEYSHDSPSYIPWTIPFPPDVSFVNSNLLALCGNHKRDVLVGISTGEVYYWLAAEGRYINCSIQFPSRSVLLSTVYCDKTEIVLVTNYNDIYHVKVEEKEEEYFDDQKTYTLQTRINRSLKVELIKSNHSFLASLAYAFGLVSEVETSVLPFIQYPYMICSRGTTVYRVNLMNGSVVGSIRLDQVLRCQCQIKGVCGNDSGNAAILIQRNQLYSVIVCFLDHQGVTTTLHVIDLPSETQFENTPVIIFRRTWSDIPSFRFLETPDGDELCFWTHTNRPVITVISLRTSSIVHYSPRFPTPALMVEVLTPFAGLVVLCSDRTIRFIPEENSTEKSLNNEMCSLFVPAACQQMVNDDYALTWLLQATHLMYRHLYYSCFYYISGIERMPEQMIQTTCHRGLIELLETSIDGSLVSGLQQRCDLVCSMIQLFSNMHFIHLLSPYAETISISLSDLLLRESLAQAIQSQQLSTEDRVQTLHVHDQILRQHGCDLTPLLTELQRDHSIWILRDCLRSLLHYHSILTPLLPPSLHISCWNWSSQAGIQDYIRSVLSTPFPSTTPYHTSQFSQCMIEICTNCFLLFPSSSSLTSLLYSVLHQIDPNIAYSFAVDHHGYEYLSTLDMSKILSILQTDTHFAEYVLRQDARDNKARLFSICNMVPDLANSILHEYPQYYWLFQLHSTPEACDAILDTIKQIHTRSTRSIALACLWFQCITHNCEKVKNEVERLQEMIACEEKLTGLEDDLTECTLSDLTKITLNGIEEWNEISKERITSLLTRINLGREQGEELMDIELAILHHALCVDEGRHESCEKSMLYYVLNSLQYREVEKWRRELVHLFHINEEYQGFWDTVVGCLH